MSPVFVQDADGCVVPAVVDSDGTPTEAFTAAVRKRRRPRVNLPDGPDGPGVKDGKYTYHDPGTGRFAPYGFITPSKLKALLNPDARKRKEVLGELQDKLDDNDPLLAEYVRALRQGDKNRARQIAAAIRRAVIGDRPAAGDDRNAWDAGSREVAKLIPAAAKRADARGVHASNVPRNQIGMNPRVEAEAAAKERLAEMRNGGSLSTGRKVDFDEPEDAVDVNRPTAPGKTTAADVQPGDTVDGLRNVKGAHKVDAIRPDDSGAGYFIRLDGENEERFVHRDRLLTVTSGDRTETPEPDRAAEPLTPDQRAALEWYSGQGFGEINGRLRSGDDESDAETIATIDSAMAPLPQMTVNRTFTSEDALGDPDALLGKTLTDDAYMSTAKGGRTGGLAPLAVEIDVPEGTLGRDISDLSENPHEGEVLLGRGARLEITGVERNEFGLVRLKARVVTDATGESGPDVGVDTPEVDPQIGRFRLADWEAIQPWKVERDPANPDPSALLLNGEPAPTWLKFSSALGTEAASHTDQAILLKPAFFALPTEESKRSALYHEAGHGLSDRMLEDQSAFDLVDDLPDFGHLNGQSTPGEVAAEAFSILWSEPSYLDEHAPGIRDAIIRKASEYGYPLPAGVRGTEPEPVDLIDTVEEQGGFTLDPRLGELVTRGIAVAVPGESAIIKADRFREDGEAERFIGDYIRKMRDDGLGDDVMIGAWYDREHDEIVLDRVQVFPDDQREEAIQAGRDRNEQAVYDLTNSNEIPTGGSGGREDINIIGGSDGDRTSEAVEGPDGRRDRPDDVPPGFQPATPDEVRDAARLNGTVRARVGNQGRMRRFAVGDEIEARYRDDEFADVWATTPEGKRRKYRVRWDRLDAFTDTDASGARYGTSDQVKDAAAATDGPIAARIADGRLSRLGLNAGDTIQVEYLNPHHGIVHVPTRDGGVRKYKVRWDRLDAHGGTADQATPTTPEPRGPKKKSGPASQANRDAKKARLTALAEENGYSYEEIRDAERQLGQIKEAIRAEAKQAAYDALGQLELLGGSNLKRVAPKRQVTDARTGRKVWKRDAASEWDWYDDLDAFEDRRLRSRWMVEGGDTTGGMNPDELAGWAFNAGLTPDDSIESGIGWYLEVTARIDAAESLGRGRLAPGTDRVNLDGLAPTTTGDARISVTDLFGPQSIDDQILAVAAASRDTDANRGLDEESGYAMLGDTVHLPADEQPWTFTRDDWGAEGDRLVAAATADDATEDDLAALKNHIPQGVLDITTDDDDWGELYDWMAAAATAAGYDNVGTRGAASPEPEPEADRPKSRFSRPEGTPPPPAWEPPPREDRPEPPPEPEDGYRMEHRPDDTGPNAASIAGGESDDAEWSMPSDVLQYPERYTGASDMLDETVRQLRAVEGDPDGEVTIYRAAPPGTGIRPGDWVTMSRAYAEQHNESNVGGEGGITAITVPARDVKFAGDDLMEWGYWPSETAPPTPEPTPDAPGPPAAFDAPSRGTATPPAPKTEKAAVKAGGKLMAQMVDWLGAGSAGEIQVDDGVPTARRLESGIVLVNPAMLKHPEDGGTKLRFFTHEAAHSMSGPQLPGIAHTVEEGSVELLSQMFWHENFAPTENDAVRIDDAWYSGPGYLWAGGVYANDTREVLGRILEANPDATYADVKVELLRLAQSDHYERIQFRDDTAGFSPATGTQIARLFGGDDTDAAALDKWIAQLDAEPDTPDVPGVEEAPEVNMSDVPTAPDAPAEPGVPGGAPYPIVPQVIPEAAAAQRASAERDLTDGDVAEMEQTIADAPQKLRVRVPSETLATLLSDGRWRTQYETGTTRGADDLDGPRGRRAGERERFGAPIDLPDADRPVYGIVDDGPITMRESQKYGEVVFHVKPEVADRTSVTFGDSLAGSGGSIPLGQDDDPDVLGAWSGAWQRGRYADQPIGGIGYTEAQFHGGLTLDDIEPTAEFHYDPSVRSEAHVERAARALTKQGMTLAVRPAERPNNGPGFDTWDAEVGAEVDAIVADLQAKGLNVERLDSPAPAEVSAPDAPEPEAPAAEPPTIPARTVTPEQAAGMFGDTAPTAERLRTGFLDGSAFSPEFESGLFPEGRDAYSDTEARNKLANVTLALREEWAGQLSTSENTRRFHRRVAELFADRNLDTAPVDTGEAFQAQLAETNPIWAASVPTAGVDIYFPPDQHPDLGGRDGFIREQYDATQRWLADKGIGPDDDIEFYRGITGQQYDDWVAAGRPANIGSAPVAAVTADRDLADEYGPAEGGVTLKMTVKGRDVIAADSGSALPGEVLVLGTDGQMTVTGWSENRNGTFTPIGGFGERTPADFTDIAPDGKLYRATTADRTYPADGLPGAVYYSGDRSYVENYGDQVTEVDLPDDALDIRKDEDRTAMRDWMQTKLTDLQRTMVDGQAADGRAASGYVQDAHEALREDSPAATGRALANVGLAMNAVEGSDAFRSGTAQKAMLDDLGHSAMIDQEADGGYSVAFAEPPAPVENGGGTGAPSTVVA